MGSLGGQTGGGQTGEQAVLRVLAGIPAPGGGDIVSAGLVDGINIDRGVVHLALRATRANAAAMEAVAKQAHAALLAAGLPEASVVLTAEKPAAPAKQAAPKPAPKPGPGEKFLTSIPAIIAVASGKGGVGKSTVAVNLAVALAAQGKRVGLLDADIHGPSLPRMLGLSGKPQVKDGQMLPHRAFGLECNSIGFMVDEQQAMIWRGPMVMGALQQLLGQTAWGQLDIMVIDLPPGTGDAQLTLSQRVNLTGAVVVSTPQDIALLDARRGVTMFRQVGVPILGVVENMSFFCCPNCGTRTEIFGHGGARAEAASLGVPFLGEIPLLPAVREAGDAGQPVVLAAPESPAGLAFTALAATVARAVA